MYVCMPNTTAFSFFFFNMNFIEHNTKSQNKTKRYNKAYNRESLNYFSTVDFNTYIGTMINI